MKPSHETWVVVPAYNEAAVISEVIAGLMRLPYGIVVVDDGSSDETYRLAADSGAVVVRHAVNLGQGAALQTGIDYALRQPGVRFVVTFDSDGQHDPTDIARLVEPLAAGECAVTLGSRFVHNARAIGIPRRKRRLLQVAAAWTRLGTGLRVTDTHNGLRAFTADAAARIRITQNGMAHASEVLSRIAELGLRYREVPVTISYSAYSLAKGQAMANGINILWDLVGGGLR